MFVVREQSHVLVGIQQIQERKPLRKSQIMAVTSVISTVDLVENSLLRIPQYLQFVQNAEFKTKIMFRGKQPTPSSGKIL